ncbi:MAG: SUMF1/EgtB/PvdO family nonheme iron enzyme [Pseudomonadales bacterium]
MSNPSEPSSTQFDQHSGEQQQPQISPADFAPMPEQSHAPTVANNAMWRLLLPIVATAVIAFIALMLAKSVRISTQVDNPDINIDGGLQLPLGERRLMYPGSYTLSISHPEFETLHANLEIGEDDQQAFRFELKRKPDIYELRSSPETVQVSVDGVAQGETPLQNLSLEVGERQLSFDHPRYFSLQKLLNVEGGGFRQTLEIALEPAWAELTVDSVPEGAEVYSGERLLGITPFRGELIDGERLVSLKLATFNNWEQEVQVTAGVANELGLIELQPADALLNLSSRPEDAGVLVNGDYRGQTPLQLSLAADEKHNIELFKQGFGKKKETVSYASASEQSLELSLRAQTGEIQLNLRTQAVKIEVNGRAVSAKSGVLKLPAVPHRIKVSKPGYLPFVTTLTPRPGFRQRLDVALQTPAQARSAAIKPQISSPAGQTLLLFKPTAFTMGASRREPGRRANELLRKVTLKKSFYLSTTEVTNGQFRQFRSAHSSSRVEDKSLNGDQQPVVRVSWIDAALYCNWLSSEQGLDPVYTIQKEELVVVNKQANGYRLPTEAEWAWAARTLNATTLKFPWGQEWPIPPKAGNFADASGSYILSRVIRNYNDGFAATAPVAKFTPNQHRLYDLGGNVAEWVHDFYAPGQKPGELSDPFGPESSNYHVVRGSSWRHGSQVELRLSYRDYSDKERDDLGFRIARYAQ